MWTDIRSLMNNFIKGFISLKIDHMQQALHGKEGDDAPA